MSVEPQPGPSRRPKALRVVPLKDERLARKVTLAFGFMSCIPLLLMFWAFVTFVLPNLHGQAQDSLHFVVLGIIASIFVGYFVLKRTMGAVMDVVHQARAASQQLGESSEHTEGDEIVELARTFNRVTQELQHKIEELESSRELIKRLLSRIGTAMVSYEGIDNLLELIVEHASAALGAQQGCLMLVDAGKQELEVKARWPLNGQSAPPQRIKFGEGVAGLVARAGQPMRTSRTGTAGQLGGHVTEGAVLCVPLITRNRTIGVMSVVRQDATRPFAEDDELLLANIGSQLAVAIENYRLNLDVERTYIETVTALAMAVEAKDPYSAGHSKRVGFYAGQIARQMGLDEETQKTLHEAGLLHDVGKIGIKDEILLKAGSLSPEELRIMQQHPLIGQAILRPVHSLGNVAEIIRSHHEAYDGSGYPSGLTGEEIPLMTRILTVADSYDSMATDRPYRKRLSDDEVKRQLCQGAGKQFDPAAVDAFLKILAEKDARRAPASS